MPERPNHAAGSIRAKQRVCAQVNPVDALFPANPRLDGWRGAGQAQDESRRAFRDLRELCERVARLPLVAQPGSAWHYGLNTDVRPAAGDGRST